MPASAEDRQLHIYVPTTLFDRVWARAEREERSVSWIVRAALRAFLDDEEAL